jgi:stage V sporulation protein G
MRVTEIRIYPTNEDLVRAYVTITFDNCLMIREIKVIKGTTGYFVSMPSRKQRDGTRQAIAYPANAETRDMIEQAILAEYEKVVKKVTERANANKWTFPGDI